MADSVPHEEDVLAICCGNVLTEPEIHPIENPAERFRDRVKKIPITDYKYIIEDWRI